MIYSKEFIMKHLIPLTPDQITVVRRSLKASLKYADSEYINEVDKILQTIEENSLLWKQSH